MVGLVLTLAAVGVAAQNVLVTEVAGKTTADGAPEIDGDIRVDRVSSATRDCMDVYKEGPGYADGVGNSRVVVGRQAGSWPMVQPIGNRPLQGL